MYSLQRKFVFHFMWKPDDSVILQVSEVIRIYGQFKCEKDKKNAKVKSEFDKVHEKINITYQNTC